MWNRILKITLHLFLCVLLTVLTQIGGVVYLISVFSIRAKAKKRRWKVAGVFIGVYLVATFLIVPLVAPQFGREKIKNSDILQAHSVFYTLANRNYVRPELNITLGEIAIQFEKNNSGIKLIYLDANFPFIDGFPLLPHLSHDDGKKIDVSLIYEDSKGQITNKKPSVSGYGIYEGPKGLEFDMVAACKNMGYFQYDFPKYLSLGKIHGSILFSEKGTRELAQYIVRQDAIGKLFIEPHLKSRLNLRSEKVRFHGCRAVRHDDHIHFQLK